MLENRIGGSDLMAIKINNWKKLLCILAMFFLNNCGGSQLAFDETVHTMDGISDRPYQFKDIKKEIKIFTRKLVDAQAKQPRYNEDQYCATVGDARCVNAGFIVEGLTALSEKMLDQANEAFQQALKFEPQSAMLHKLNGLTHQLRGDAGDHSHYKLAEVGYSLASRFDPGDSETHYFMGVLQFHQGNFKTAQEHFSNAIIQDPNYPDYFIGLAGSSYYLGELGRAYANIEKALSLNPYDAPAIQASGLIHASLGAFDKANSRSNLLGSMSKMKQRYLQKRIRDWKNYYNQNGSQKDEQLKNLFAQNLDIFGIPEGGMFDSTDTDTGDPLARDKSDETSDDETSDSVDSQDAAPLPSKVAPTPLPSKASPTPMTFPLKKDRPAIVKSTPISAPLAAKKKVTIPAMAMVDVAIIRTEEIFKSGKGVNLLDGLNIFFTAPQLLLLNNVVRTIDTVNDATTLQLGTSGAGITYSLNIFSNDYDRNEVIARPTITVEDKKKSAFYSGDTLHIVLEGGVAGSSSMQDLPTGVKLEVTPKFLDKDTIDLKVYAERSSLESSLSQVSDTITGTSFASTAKTTIAANLTLRYDETMVLSGLDDQEKQIIDNKVPVLGDVPGLQYFFRRQTKTTSKETILILLTPRRASITYEDGVPVSENVMIKTGSIDKLEKNADWMRPASHLKGLVQHLGKYEFFTHYRKGDMRLDNWAGEGTIGDAIRRALSYLYIFYDFEKDIKPDVTPIQRDDSYDDGY